MESDREREVITPRDEPGPTPLQRLKARGRTPSPRWRNKVFVADLDRRVVEVRSKEDVTSSQ